MEILHTYPFNNSFWGFPGIITLIAAVVCGIILIGNLIYHIEKWKEHLKYSLIVIVCIVLTVLFFKLTAEDETLRHRVIIKDIQQFDYNKYKIVEQDGKIFTIEEVKR